MKVLNSMHVVLNQVLFAFRSQITFLFSFAEAAGCKQAGVSYGSAKMKLSLRSEAT